MKKRFSLTGVKMLALGLVVGGAFAASAQAADCPAGAICRYDEQPGGYTGDGPYRVGNYSISTFQAAGGATVYYPVNAQPPFAALVFCPPYTGVQYMYRDWGPFFASHGCWEDYENAILG